MFVRHFDGGFVTKKVLFLILFILITHGCGVQGYQKRPIHTSSPKKSSNTVHLGKYRFRKVGTAYGKASFYGKKFHGRKTANGEIFNMFRMTAAHRTLPFGTMVRVTNLKNKRSLIVRINDRGPFVKGRIIDLSYGAAKKLGFINDGVVKVKLEKLELINSK